eukprot:6839303-Prymnesium_polylepis.1
MRIAGKALIIHVRRTRKRAGQRRAHTAARSSVRLMAKVLGLTTTEPRVRRSPRLDYFEERKKIDTAAGAKVTAATAASAAGAQPRVATERAAHGHNGDSTRVSRTRTRTRRAAEPPRDTRNQRTK